MIVNLITTVYNFLWGDLFTIPLPGGGSLGISLLILLLIPTGIYFTIRTRFLPIRLFPDMIRALSEKKNEKSSLSSFQTLIVSTATRVGMGNLVGVVAAVSAGGAGAVFWMWVTAIIGSSTAFIEATLAQLHKEEDPLYGGYRGGPAYYIHDLVEDHLKKKKRYVLPAVLFAIAGLVCWCGISQVISNSVASSFKNAFSIPPLYTSIMLVILSAIIVLRKNATVKVLDFIVPVMAVCYFFITLFIIAVNLRQIPSVFARIFEEAFGLRQMAAGGFGAVLMNGVKRGLFSNEAGSGSAPCAAAAAECDRPAKAGLVQALGVFVDTIVICSCTAMIMLLAPKDLINGLSGMDLLQTAMQYHLGKFGVIFIALTLFLTIKPSYSVIVNKVTSTKVRLQLEKLGVNGSPIYATAPITAKRKGNTVSFKWKDTWGNSGTGTLKLYKGYVKLKVKQTYTARWNRSTLDTSGKYMKIYRKSGNTKMDNIDL